MGGGDEEEAGAVVVEVGGGRVEYFHGGLLEDGLEMETEIWR